MRTKLQAVQEIMRRVGKLPADELDTDGVSVASHVERALDDASLSIQNEGWWWNTKYNVEVTQDANKKIEVGRLEQETALSISGASQASPCVLTVGTTDGLQSNSRVFVDGVVGMSELNGRYHRVKKVISATQFSIDEDSTSHTSYIASGTATPLRTIYHVDTDREDSATQVTRTGDFLFDLNENVDTFDSDLKLRYVYDKPWAQIPDAYQVWIISIAALNFNRNYIGNAGRDSVLQQEVMDSKRQAFRDEIRSSDVNLLDTAEMRQVRGRPRMPDRRIY